MNLPLVMFTLISGVTPLMDSGIKDNGGMWVKIDGDDYWAPTVNELKDSEIKVRLRHTRNRSKTIYTFGRGRVLPKGGSTYILLLAPDGHWAEGYARCSNKDNFSKKKGYVLAVNDALSKLNGDLYPFDARFIEALKDRKLQDDSFY